MILVTASPCDLDCISRLSEVSVDSTLSKVQLSVYQTKNDLLCIKFGDEVIGFIVQKIVLDEAELIQIVISEKKRNQGYGFNALSEWHSQLIKQSVIVSFLDVRETNKAANALYQKLGYQVVGRRKSYYDFEGRKVDGLIMTRNSTSFSDM